MERLRDHYKVGTNELVVTNMCPICSSIFASIETARTHLRDAVRRDGCKIDLGMVVDVVEIPDDFRCPAEGCEYEGSSLTNLNQHFTNNFGSI